MRDGATKAKILAAGFVAVAILSMAGCSGQVDQEACEDVALLERQLDSVAGDLRADVEQEVREDYAEIATQANCPGYNNPDE